MTSGIQFFSPASVGVDSNGTTQPSWASPVVYNPSSHSAL